MLDVAVDFNEMELTARIKGRIARSVQPAFDTQVMKDSNYFVPVDKHYLESSVVTSSKVGEGVLVWNEPYAKKQYHEFENKSKDQNPNARMEWFEWAKSIYLKAWLALAQMRYGNG